MSKHTFSVPLALLLVLALAIPALAGGGDDDEVEVGAVEVKLRPAVAPVDAPVQIRIKIDTDEDSDDETDETDKTDETDDGASTGPPASLPSDEEDEGTDDEDAAPPVTSWTATADLGDGSPPVDVALRADDDDEIKGRLMHRYAAEGTYTVTVTATPEVGDPVQLTLEANVGQGSARLARKDRFGTAVRISEEAFPEDGTAAAVLLARGDNFADALAASSLSLVEDAAVLLTTGDAVPDVVLAEIERVLAPTGTIYVFGGEAAISPEIVTTLEELGYTVVRIAGSDRIDTSVQIARFLMSRGVEIDEVILAGAGSFPDALAVGPHAAKHAIPVLLTGRTSLDPRVVELLVELGDVDITIVGGAAVVGQEVVDELEALGFDVERLSGKDRFETAAAIAAATAPDADAAVLATGGSFADALAGASYAARADAPILLVSGDLPAAARAALEARTGHLKTLHVLGGEGAVSDTVRRSAEDIVGVGRP